MPTTYAIPNGRTVFNATTYSGNATTNPISNADNATLGFQPDLVWMKSRGNNYDNTLFDSVRGTGAKDLSSNQTQVEGTNYAANYVNFSSFNTNGFTLGATSSTNIINNSGGNFIAWQWKAGAGTTSTNTSGSITSTVSVNQAAGFSIVTYTGNETQGATVGHGLGAIPSMIIVKARNDTQNWPVYHISTGNTGACLLNLTNSFVTAAGDWSNTTPTSSVFTLGGGSQSDRYNTNKNGNNYVAYCWAPIAGYSAFGSYTGNGSTDGPFVYLGFRPKFIIIKNSSASTDWKIMDTSRDVYNPEISQIGANVYSAEDANSGYAIDYLSNGFKIRNTYSTWNGSGNSLIYAAWAENPFKYSNAR
jgi:hypothetical protein